MSATSEPSSTNKLPISGVVLAGGRSRRFGQDKASYVYKGKRMLDWALESLSGTQERFVIANQNYKTDFPIYEDIRTNCSDTGCGPMGGLYTALTYAKHEWIALAACDMPNLNPDYWRHLYRTAAMSNAKYAVVIKTNDTKLQTLAALYNKALLPIIEDHLDTNKIALQSLAEHFNIIDIDSFKQDNINNSQILFQNFNFLGDVK